MTGARIEHQPDHEHDDPQPLREACAHRDEGEPEEGCEPERPLVGEEQPDRVQADHREQGELRESRPDRPRREHGEADQHADREREQAALDLALARRT